MNQPDLHRRGDTVASQGVLAPHSFLLEFGYSTRQPSIFVLYYLSFYLKYLKWSLHEIATSPQYLYLQFCQFEKSSLLHEWPFSLLFTFAMGGPGLSVAWVLSNIFDSFWGTSNGSNLGETSQMWHVPPNSFRMASPALPSLSRKL